MRDLRIQSTEALLTNNVAALPRSIPIEESVRNNGDLFSRSLAFTDIHTVGLTVYAQRPDATLLSLWFGKTKHCLLEVIDARTVIRSL